MSKKSDRPATPAGLLNLVKIIAKATDINEIFSTASDLADTYIGHRLFTVMTFDLETMQVQRVYSSNPDAYPPGGTKAKEDTQWGYHVLVQGRPFIGNSATAIRANFDDHEVILGLGLASVLNVPIRVCGQTIGTVNLLNKAGFYGEADLEWGYILASQLAGIPSFHTHQQ